MLMGMQNSQATLRDSLAALWKASLILCRNCASRYIPMILNYKHTKAHTCSFMALWLIADKISAALKIKNITACKNWIHWMKSLPVVAQFWQSYIYVYQKLKKSILSFVSSSFLWLIAFLHLPSCLFKVSSFKGLSGFVSPSMYTFCLFHMGHLWSSIRPAKISFWSEVIGTDSKNQDHHLGWMLCFASRCPPKPPGGFSEMPGPRVYGAGLRMCDY